MLVLWQPKWLHNAYFQIKLHCGHKGSIQLGLAHRRLFSSVVFVICSQQLQIFHIRGSGKLRGVSVLTDTPTDSQNKRRILNRGCAWCGDLVLSCSLTPSSYLSEWGERLERMSVWGLIRNVERHLSSDPDTAGRDCWPRSSSIETGDTHTYTQSLGLDRYRRFGFVMI